MPCRPTLLLQFSRRAPIRLIPNLPAFVHPMRFAARVKADRARSSAPIWPSVVDYVEDTRLASKVRHPWWFDFESTFTERSRSKMKDAHFRLPLFIAAASLLGNAALIAAA